MIQASRRIFAFVVFFALLSGLCPAQPTASSGLDRALDSIKAENIKADIFFIASDELGGRDTPSNGQRVAARFIRARLQRLGVLPGTSEGYFYPYKLYRRELDLGATKAQAVKSGATIEFNFGSDYSFYANGINTAVTSGNVVWCGDATVEQMGSFDLAGKWALCEDNGLMGEERRKVAQKAAAIGVLLAPGPKATDEKVAKRIRDSAGLVMRPGVQNSPPKSAEREFFPSMSVSGAAVTRLLALAGNFDRANSRPPMGTDLGIVFTDTRKDNGPDGTVMAEDVCGFFPGSDPVLGKEVIIISAHYDHIGTEADGTVNNGADDNGSGTTGLLQLAEALTINGPMRRSVFLIWVSGEEKGLWGSKAWCSAPSLPQGYRPICDLNIDMIGRNAPDMLLITPTKARKDDYNGLTRLAEKFGPLEGFPVLGSADEYWTRSDHFNFAKLQIPVAFLFSDVHEDYHRPTDDPEKIDCDKIRRVTRMVLRMIDGLQGDKLDL
ncbi:MAG TPA: M28 family peptidase [Planctomycetota bacterium]|nr:M28 family peptidase [Planctomycetota bacterium]